MRTDILTSLLEASMEKLARGTDEGRRERASALRHYYMGMGRDSDGNAVTKWRIPSGTVRNKMHHCFIAVIPAGGSSLFAIARARKDLRSRMDAIRNSDVKCFCTCKDFNFSGARYNLNQMGSLEKGHESEKGVPDGSGIAPTRRRGILLCKHLLAAFSGMKTNCGRIMKDAATSSFARKNDAGDGNAMGEFFKADGETLKSGKLDKATIDVDKELLETKPVKLEAAAEGLESLAMAAAGLDNGTPTEPDAASALDEFGLDDEDATDTAESREDTATEVINELVG